MKIRVQFYSQLRDLAGRQAVDLDLPEGATVAALLDKIYHEMPPLRAHDKAILTGVGVEFVERDYVIKPGDEISVMPPVQGG